MAAERKLRCAIYTRKSTEEGLEQNFNSLDAQRDACEAFIASQKSEGWVMLRDRYDDGGYSGGNMSRPGLQQLLEDIREGLVDVIVVYKIDRLSRSLVDFARLVELFDEHQVTFVSVTQAFNTTTSMGRLTLNILLSFAQFERELSGERVRDKIAASRQRGIWMGGNPPLGYDVCNRKLVPNPTEAPLVVEIFSRFAAAPSMATLLQDLRVRGVTSKAWTTTKGTVRVGRPIDKGYIYKLLNNPVYLGLAAHKGQLYPGEHQALVEQATWDQVQAHLKSGRSLAKGATADRLSRTPTLLRGLLFSEEGRAFTPSYTSKGQRHYRYYVNTASIKLGRTGCEVQRVPAGEIELTVTEQVRHILRSTEVTAEAVRVVRQQRPDIEDAEAIAMLTSIDAVWEVLFPAEQASIIRTLIERITIRVDGLQIAWRDQGVAQLLSTQVKPKPVQEAA
jgi:DNA invertase Pin-like site-specific DNA recombinase